MCVNVKNYTQGRGHGGMEEKKEEERPRSPRREGVCHKSIRAKAHVPPCFPKLPLLSGSLYIGSHLPLHETIHNLSENLAYASTIPPGLGKPPPLLDTNL
jgi:hypothetical protein